MQHQYVVLLNVRKDGINRGLSTIRGYHSAKPFVPPCPKTGRRSPKSGGVVFKHRLRRGGGLWRGYENMYEKSGQRGEGGRACQAAASTWEGDGGGINAKGEARCI